MTFWWRSLIEMIFSLWLRRQKNRAVSRLKLEGLKTYLKTLQVARLSAVGIVCLLVALQLMCLGLLVMVAAAVYLAPLAEDVKLWVIFGTGAVLFTLPFLALTILLSERLWYHVSGAQEMVQKTLEKDAA